MAAGRAYEAAGYSVRGTVADTQASKLLTNPKVARALDAERLRNRTLATLGRIEKLSVLEEIARDSNAKNRDRISAIKVHNEMTGENAPQRFEISEAESLIDTVRAIAESGRMISPLLLAGMTRRHSQ